MNGCAQHAFVLFALLVLNCGAEVITRTQVAPTNGHPVPGSNVTFAVWLTQSDKVTPLVGRDVQYEVMLNGGKRIKKGTLVSGEEPVSLSVRTEADSWYLTRFRPLEEGEAPRDRLRASGSGVGAVTSASDFRSAIPEPADFDAFWAAALAELKTVPMQSTMTQVEVAEEWKGKLRVYDVKVDCAGGAPVSGYLTVPEGAAPGSLPAIVRYPGAGVRTASRYYHDNIITFGINGHGIANGKSEEFYKDLQFGALLDYHLQGNDDPATCYFRAMFQRAVRALDYVMGRPEWNGKDLIAYGGSMGAAQAIAVSSLYPAHVTLCVTHFPAMCDHAGSLADPPRKPGWPQSYYADTSQPLPEELRKVVACMNYFDTIHFGKRLQCPFYTSVGYTDTLTPPTGIHALINTIDPERVKSVTIGVKQGHGGVFSRTGDAEIQRLIESRAEERSEP